MQCGAQEMALFFYNKMDTRLTSVRCEGGLSVETTAWEGWKAKQEGANGER